MVLWVGGCGGGRSTFCCDKLVTESEHYSEISKHYALFCLLWLVAGGWCWFAVREKYHWLAADWCWFGVRKSLLLVANRTEWIIRIPFFFLSAKALIKVLFWKKNMETLWSTECYIYSANFWMQFSCDQYAGSCLQNRRKFDQNQLVLIKRWSTIVMHMPEQTLRTWAGSLDSNHRIG